MTIDQSLDLLGYTAFHIFNLRNACFVISLKVCSCAIKSNISKRSHLSAKPGVNFPIAASTVRIFSYLVLVLKYMY